MAGSIGKFLFMREGLRGAYRHLFLVFYFSGLKKLIYFYTNGLYVRTYSRDLTKLGFDNR